MKVEEIPTDDKYSKAGEKEPRKLDLKTAAEILADNVKTDRFHFAGTVSC